MGEPYNGFPVDVQNRSWAWLLAQWKAGRLPRPRACMACGQTKGVIDAHAEDYSEPFGPHIQAFHLCRRCHTMLHQRAQNPEAWRVYKRLVNDGWQWPPYRDSRPMRHWLPDFIAQMGVLGGVELVNAPRVPRLLDEIDAGVFNPNR